MRRVAIEHPRGARLEILHALGWPSAASGTRDPPPQEKLLSFWERGWGEGHSNAGLSAARRPLLDVRRVAIEHPRRPRLEVLYAAVGRLPHAERATHLRKKKPLSFWERGWGEGHSNAGVSRPATTPRRAPCSHRTPTTAPARSSVRAGWPFATRGTRDPLPQEKPLSLRRVPVVSGGRGVGVRATQTRAISRPATTPRRAPCSHRTPTTAPARSSARTWLAVCRKRNEHHICARKNPSPFGRGVGVRATHTQALAARRPFLDVCRVAIEHPRRPRLEVLYAPVGRLPHAERATHFRKNKPLSFWERGWGEGHSHAGLSAARRPLLDVRRVAVEHPRRARLEVLHALGWPSAASGTSITFAQEKPLSFWERGLGGEGHSHAGVSRPATTPRRAPCSHRTPTRGPARSSARGCWPSATRGTRDPPPQEIPLSPRAPVVRDGTEAVERMRAAPKPATLPASFQPGDLSHAAAL